MSVPHITSGASVEMMVASCAWGRTCAWPTSCRAWRSRSPGSDRLAAIRAWRSRGLEAQQRAADDASRSAFRTKTFAMKRRAASSKRSIWPSQDVVRRRATSTGPGERDHEDEQRRVPAVHTTLQRGGRWCAPVGGGRRRCTANASDAWRWCAGAASIALAETVGRAAGDGAGGRRLQQLSRDLGGPGNASSFIDRVCHRSLGREGKAAIGPATRRSIPRRVAWPRRCRGRPGRAAYAELIKWLSEAPQRRGSPAPVTGIQDRFSLRGLAQVQGEWRLGVPGVEHQAPARPDGGVTRGRMRLATTTDRRALGLCGGPGGPSRP